MTAPARRSLQSPATGNRPSGETRRGPARRDSSPGPRIAPKADKRPTREHDVRTRTQGPAAGGTSLRPPDAALEPAHAPLHPRRARWDPHHRPAADRGAAARGAQLRRRARRPGRQRPLRRHQEAGARLGPVVGRALRDAVRQPALARRAADQLPHDLGADRPPARAHRVAGRRSTRPAPDQGADVDGVRAREARVQPRRCSRHEAPAAGSADHRPEDRGDRGRRVRAPADPDSRPRRLERRPGRGRVPDPRQRRLDALLRARDLDRRRGNRGVRQRVSRTRGEAARRGGGAPPGRGGGEAQARRGRAGAQGGRGGRREGGRGAGCAADAPGPQPTPQAPPAGEQGAPRQGQPPGPQGAEPARGG